MTSMDAFTIFMLRCLIRLEMRERAHSPPDQMRLLRHGSSDEIE